MNCLLVIDMQKGFMEDKKLIDFQTRLQIQARIVSSFRDLQQPIIYTRFKKYRDIIPELSPLEDESVLIKKHSDSYEDSELFDLTKDFSRIHVIGCNSWPCVALTIDSGLERGLKFVAYKNGILSRNSNKKEEFYYLTLRYLLNPGVKVKNWVND